MQKNTNLISSHILGRFNHFENFIIKIVLEFHIVRNYYFKIIGKFKNPQNYTKFRIKSEYKRVAKFNKIVAQILFS